MPLKINAYVIAAKWQPKTKVVKSQKTVGDVGIFTAVIEVIKEQTVYFKLCCIHCIVLPYIDLTIYCIMYLHSVLNPCVFVYLLRSTNHNTVGLYGALCLY